MRYIRQEGLNDKQRENLGLTVMFSWLFAPIVLWLLTECSR